MAKGKPLPFTPKTPKTPKAGNMAMPAAPFGKAKPATKLLPFGKKKK